MEKKRGRPKGARNKNKSPEKAQQSHLVPPEPEITKKQKQPKVQKPKVKPQTNYIYTDLSKVCLGSTELYNIYMIVIDAGSPHHKKQWCRQLLRVIDPTVYPKIPKDPQDLNNGSLTVTFFGKTFDDLPKFKKIGDILRVHRANSGSYMNQKNVCINMSYGSTWTIFDGLAPFSSCDELIVRKEEQAEKKIKGFFMNDDQNADQDVNMVPEDAFDRESLPKHYFPTSSSKPEYNFTLQDKQILDKMRKFIREYFEQDFLVDNAHYWTLNKVRDYINNHQLQNPDNLLEREFDLLVKVEEVREEEGNTTVLRITDLSQCIFEVRAPADLVPQGVKASSVVRIKSASALQTQKNTLECSEGSNILLISPTFKQYQQFMEKYDLKEYDLRPLILGETVQQQSININPDNFNFFQQLQTEEVLEKPEIISTIHYQFKNYDSVDLYDLYYNEQNNQNASDSNLIRVQFYVLNIQPLNLYEISQLYCSQCLQTYSYKDIKGMNCKQCSNDLEQVYKIQFLVKDKSISQTSLVFRALLYTCGGICNKFFNGIQPSNLYADQNVRMQLEKYVRQLLRFNVYVDAIVEKKYVGQELVLRIVNSKLKSM